MLGGPPSGAAYGRIACLSSAPLFRDLSAAELGEIAAVARDRRVAPKRVLFREGEPARELAILTAGRMKLTQLTTSGEIVIQRIAGPSEVLSGLGVPALGLHPATSVALEPSDVLAWETRAFERFTERFPVLHRNALRILAERVRELEERCRELATANAAPRLARTLLRLLGQMGRPRGEGVVIALSREELGQMIGTTLFSVSRILSQWETQGFLRAAREAVIVVDPAGLVAAAEPTVADEAAPSRGFSPSARRG